MYRIVFGAELPGLLAGSADLRMRRSLPQLAVSAALALMIMHETHESAPCRPRRSCRLERLCRESASHAANERFDVDLWQLRSAGGTVDVRQNHIA